MGRNKQPCFKLWVLSVWMLAALGFSAFSFLSGDLKTLQSVCLLDSWAAKGEWVLKVKYGIR